MKNILLLLLFLASGAFAQNYTVCAGQIQALSAYFDPSLSNPAYSINPGGFTSTSPQFFMSPTVTTTYTLYTTGTSCTVTSTTIQTATVVVKYAPSYTLTASPGFSLGCNSKSIT